MSADQHASIRRAFEHFQRAHDTLVADPGRLTIAAWNLYTEHGRPLGHDLQAMALWLRYACWTTPN